jgi:type I restriction enzyme R subunit
MYVVPRLQAVGWEEEPHSIAEQRSFTAGRIIVAGSKVKRREARRADYVLRYTRDFPIAVVEAKSIYKLAGDGLAQAKEYALTLGLKFAYATNGEKIIEFDFLTGNERELNTFPSPGELWSRLTSSEKLTENAADQLLTPGNYVSGNQPRYYQEIAINRTIQSLLQGKRRILLTMATGTGKTDVAFQICWKIWQARWNRTGEHRKPRILYLADRNILIDDPKDKTFSPFGEARWKIQGEANKSREMYFAIYQAIAQDENRPGLYREYSRDFFDLIIVDECHRGSARDTSNWREILDYFEPAYKLGMTATPLRDDNRDTYAYFGNPIYTYSLRQGIDDGFLAPYRVHRVVTTADAVGWRPSQGDLDRYGREIPDDEYQTRDFERAVALRKRTEAIAQHIVTFLRNTDAYAKTIVFCVDQEHAEEMRAAISRLCPEQMRNNSDYVCRVTSDEGDRGRGFLSRFQELETSTPAILTTSQLLTTGVNAPTCKNIVLARVIGSMTDFKQIIGRGTRVREDYGKLNFNILDYTGSATRLFADSDFDGEPARITEEEIDENGLTVPGTEIIEPGEDEQNETLTLDDVILDWIPERRKYYFDGGQFEIAAHLVYELDPDGKQLRVVKFTDYTGDKVRTLYQSPDSLRQKWADYVQREEILAVLEDRGIDIDRVRLETQQPEADGFDLLCHLAFNAPLRTRRERADRLRTDRKDFFDQYVPEARAILNELLDKYAEHGTSEFAIPESLKVPPISAHGNVMEIAAMFGGADKLKFAVAQMQQFLYSA